ncbi:MAG: hypothetical protein IJ722_06950 [Alloprevotella sp.]|nr:hypothetical protein [Alloprevotella sp.]
MKDEKTLGGALCAGVGTADAAEGAVPAAGTKKYVPPTMQVIPLDPQRLLATSGGLPVYDVCDGLIYDPLYIFFPDGDWSAHIDEVTRMLSSGSLTSDPAGVASWANSQSWSAPAPFSYPFYDLPGHVSLTTLLQSAVITSAESSVKAGKAYTNGRIISVNWGFTISGYVPDQYSFTLNGSFGDTECFTTDACYGSL